MEIVLAEALCRKIEAVGESLDLAWLTGFWDNNTLNCVNALAISEKSDVLAAGLPRGLDIPAILCKTPVLEEERALQVWKVASKKIIPDTQSEEERPFAVLLIGDSLSSSSSSSSSSPSSPFPTAAFLIKGDKAESVAVKFGRGEDPLSTLPLFRLSFATNISSVNDLDQFRARVVGEVVMVARRDEERLLIELAKGKKGEKGEKESSSSSSSPDASKPSTSLYKTLSKAERKAKMDEGQRLASPLIKQQITTVTMHLKNGASRAALTMETLQDDLPSGWENAGNALQVWVDVFCYGGGGRRSMGWVASELRRAAIMQLDVQRALLLQGPPPKSESENNSDENNENNNNNFSPNTLGAQTLFRAPMVPHPITVFLPVDARVSDSDNDHALRATGLTQSTSDWLLCGGEPVVRLGARLGLQNDVHPLLTQHADKLVNVHLGLGPSGVANGTPAVVRGEYLYHHYNQDKFDDKGWGCAYRTFQTICSWFVLQNYVNRSIPTHREIQQGLVDIGDKNPSFVGSRQWIGAVELSSLLDHFFNISAKILFVGSGAEVASVARQLRDHFRTQGTPVMIGGGQLAYGLLGVDYNENTGDVKFLILDPHYVGPDILSTITSKVWCGWRNQDLFLRDHFYNFCLPQRPQDN